jgi:hypothetical protein
MATVRMSSAVIDKIKESAALAFLKSNPMQTYPETLGDDVYNTLYKKAEELCKQLKAIPNVAHSRALSSSSNIDVKMKGIDLSKYPKPAADLDHYQRMRTHYNSMNLNLSSERYMIQDVTFELPVGSDLHTQILGILDYNLNIKTLLEDNLKKVESVVDSCSTVNQFIKAWPAGASLVPEESLRKANQRSVRKQAAESRRALVENLETDLNTSLLTSSLLD